MEIKKVQEVKGSYYIYLPKSWCKKYLPNENSQDKSKNPREVQLKRNPDDSILILPRDRPVADTLSLSLELDASVNEDTYLNSVLAGYIVGIDRIELETKTKFSLEFRAKISQLLNQLIGFETTQESQNKVIMQEVSTTLKLGDMMRRMLSKVGLILNDLHEVMKTMDSRKAKVLIETDSEIDKFRYSIERQVHHILLRPHLARDLKISPIECHHFSQCTKYIERIADHCIDIASNILENKNPSPKLLEIYQEVRELYMQMQHNFYSDDIAANYNIISQHYQVTNKISEIELQNKDDQAFTMHLNRICSYCSDIAEVSINSFVYKKSHKIDLLI